jgi:hypothetical protein
LNPEIVVARVDWDAALTLPRRRRRAALDIEVDNALQDRHERQP